MSQKGGASMPEADSVQEISKLREGTSSFLKELGLEEEPLPVRKSDKLEDLIADLTLLIVVLRHETDCTKREVKRLQRVADSLVGEKIRLERKNETLEEENGKLALEAESSEEALRREQRKRKKADRRE